MEEKERYEWNSRFDEAIKDNQTGDIVNAVEVLNKQDKKLADLEAKLAESEHRNEQLVDALNGEVFINYKLPMENAQLKQQLADLQSEQIKEMQEHQEAMLVADKKIKELEEQLAELIHQHEDKGE